MSLCLEEYDGVNEGEREGCPLFRNAAFLDYEAASRRRFPLSYARCVFYCLAVELNYHLDAGRSG